MPRHNKARRKIRSNKISLKKLWARDKGICYLCNKPVSILEASRDHVKPRSAGGTNGSSKFSNIKLTHEICNQRKADSVHWNNYEVY